MREACDKVNVDLQSLSEFSKGHALVLNPQKSAAMLFGRRLDRERSLGLVEVFIDGDRVPIVNVFKNLGLYMDNSFRYKKHISECLRRAYCNLKEIYSIRRALDSKAKSLLCNSLVLSHFNYCDIVYGPCLDSRDRSRIQKLQNSCLRLVFGLRKFDRISHKLNDLRWLNMLNRRHLHASCMFWRLLITRTPPYLYAKIQFRTDVHTLNLRHRGRLTPPKHNTEFFKRSFSYCVAKLCNDLPSHLRSSSLSRFGQLLRANLLSSQ